MPSGVFSKTEFNFGREKAGVGFVFKIPGNSGEPPLKVPQVHLSFKRFQEILLDLRGKFFGHSGTLPEKEVSVEELQQMFREQKFLERIDGGHFIERLHKSNLASPKVRQDPCTHSQILYYYLRNGKKIAVVHRFLRPNGTLGGSGLPDPKSLLIKGIRYYAVNPPH